MKKVTYDEIEQVKIHTKSLRKRESRKTRKNKRKGAANSSRVRVFSRVVIDAPRSLDLFDENLYAEFVCFITEIKEQVLAGNKVLLNFKGTESLKACAMVVLYAHIDFLQRVIMDERVILVTLCRNSRVNRWFAGSGIWNLVKFNGMSGESDAQLPIYSAVSGQTHAVDAQTTIRKVITFIRDKIYGGKISKENGQKLYAAITESISNVGLHAYSDEEKFEEFIADVGKRWWILARLIDEQLFILVYDMGDGIPVTLVKRDFFSLIQQMFNHETDSDKINAAIKYGETRMKSNKHGKGLHDIKTFVVDNPMGELHIFSGMGKYTYISSSKREIQADLKYSIGGTLIQWNVCLKDN